MLTVCGICGFVSDKANKEAIIEDMMDTLVHRGPDSSGTYINQEVALGFRRLSIIDLEGGTQPIYNEDRTKVITFNGEIYNFQPLRAALVEKGHIFTTHSDTEVLLHGYEEWGVDLLQKIRGMYAFVIWDDQKKELFGARDHFGIKPFYYAEMNGTFMYASEIKAFLCHPDFIKELNRKALKPYLTFQYSALPETFFKGVYRIPEGHYFTYKDGKLDIQEYWDAKFEEVNQPKKEIIEEIDDTIVDSIKAHEIADVKVGAFLSSGVDSSYVTAVSRPNYTFSIGFDNKIYNEAEEAKQLTKLLKLHNTSRVVHADESFDYFPMIQYYLDEPDSNPSCVPLYFLSKLARHEVKVVLSGEGADELFAGYIDYGFFSNSKLIRVIGQGLKKLSKSSRYKLSRRLKGMKNFHGRKHLIASTAPAETFFIGQAKIFNEDEVGSILNPNFMQAPTVEDILAPSWEKVADQQNEIKKMQYVDIHNFMAKDILLKADKLSMANSIELRVPLLDKKVMEVAEKVPSKYLLNQNNTKDIYRQAANRHLPEEWANREKLGFPVPIKAWLHDEKYYRIIRELFEQDFAKEFFDQAAILKMLDDNYAQKIDARRKIWTIFTFLTWYQVYFVNDGRKPEVTDSTPEDIVINS